MKQILCRGCRKQWYQRSDGQCPSCGTAPWRVNSALASQGFRTALNDKAARALREG